MTMNLITRKILLLLLMLTVLMTSGSLSYGQVVDQCDRAAEELYSIGLFKGGENGFDLKSHPTRVQAAVMVVRFIGEESGITSGKTVYTHPFKDVPDWASSYVGYMYQKGITLGKTADSFGSEDYVDGNAFMAFMLRAMGYSDAKGDFNTAQALDYAASINLLSKADAAEINKDSFTRGSMAYIARKSLDTNMKDYNVSLMEYLDGKGALLKTYANVNGGIIEDRAIMDDIFLDSPSSGMVAADISSNSTKQDESPSNNINTTSDLISGVLEEEVFDGDGIINDIEVVVENPTLDDVDFAQMDSKTVEERSKLIKKAYEQLGIKYTAAGKSPSTGFDCSGFVGYVMQQSGIWKSLYGSCIGIYDQCTPISLSEAEPGDLVFFKNTYNTSNKYSHVGIYLGDNKMIHSGSSTGIAVASFGSGYWAKHYAGVARPNSFIGK